MALTVAAQSVVHDTAAAFADGSFAGLEDIGSGGTADLRLAANLLGNPYGFGTGKDGDLTVASALTMNSSSMRIGYAYNVVGTAGDTNLTFTDAHSVASIQNGDLILIHQSRHGSPGRWEVNRVASGGGSTTAFTLDRPLTYTYSSGAQLMRLMEYRNVTLNSGAQIYPVISWNGNYGGIVAFLCSGAFVAQGNGYIQVSHRGFRGGSRHCNWRQWGVQGESYYGTGGYTASRNYSGGGGGQYGTCGSQSGAGGGGGGNGAAGTTGNWNDKRQTYGGTGGSASGSQDLSVMVFGGGGGSGGIINCGSDCNGAGGNGGGIVLIAARSISLNSRPHGAASINAHGQGGGSAQGAGGGGGGGAGGSVLLNGETVNIGSGNIYLPGAGGGGTPGGDGGDGRQGGGGIARINCLAGNSVAGSLNGGEYAVWTHGTFGRHASGTYRSGAVAITGATSLASAEWTAGGSGTVRLRVRTAPDAGSLAGAAWSDWLDTSGQTLTSAANEYIQYEVELAGDGGAGTPTLTSVTLHYLTNTEPDDPSGIDPAPDAHLATSNPLFSWTTGDADGDPITNRFTLSAQPDLGNPIVDDLDLGAATSHAPGPLADGTYYWQVRVWDGQVFNPSSPVWRVTIDTQPPAPAVIDAVLQQEDGSGYLVYGTGEDGASLTVLDGSSNAISGTVSWDGDGGFTFTPDAPIPVYTDLHLHIADEAGNGTTTPGAARLSAPYASIPEGINLHARVLDGAGQPVEGDVAVTVRVFSNEVGGVARYTETLASVPAREGLLTLTFGTNGSLRPVLADPPAWLEMTVDGRTLAPRRPLLSVPYALHVHGANTARVAQVAATIESPHLFVHPLTRRVGMGTTTPATDLEVAGAVRSRNPISLSSGFSLATPTTVTAGASATLTLPADSLPAAEYRYLLWVNVGTDPSAVRTTLVEVARWHAPSGAWSNDAAIGSWPVVGRDDDGYLDQQVSRPGAAHIGHAWTDLRIDNLGPEDLEVFGVGVLQEGWSASTLVVQP